MAITIMILKFSATKQPMILTVLYIEMDFFNAHLGYSFNFTIVYLCHVIGGIPPPSGVIVGKNWSTRRKTTVRR